MEIDNALIDALYKECILSRDTHEKSTVSWWYFDGMVDLIEELQTLYKDIDLSNNNDSLKEYALSIIDDLEENEGCDLTEGTYILQWKYDERPDIQVTLVLGEFEYTEDDQGDLH